MNTATRRNVTCHLWEVKVLCDRMTQIVDLAMASAALKWNHGWKVLGSHHGSGIRPRITYSDLVSRLKVITQTSLCVITTTNPSFETHRPGSSGVL